MTRNGGVARCKTAVSLNSPAWNVLSKPVLQTKTRLFQQNRPASVLHPLLLSGRSHNTCRHLANCPGRSTQRHVSVGPKISNLTKREESSCVLARDYPAVTYDPDLHVHHRWPHGSRKKLPGDV
jgi:hypothetical protein